MKKTLIACVSGLSLVMMAPVVLGTAAGVALPGPLDAGISAGCSTTELTFGCGGDAGTGSEAVRAIEAVSYAQAQIGTPYVWGGERARVGFDCSGLAQAAWQAAGVRIPRVAQGQFDAGPHLGAGDGLEVGDLVFFGSGPSDVTHVGIVVDPSGEMIDAPHTGALVRVDRFPVIPGRYWGGEVFVGATRPGGAA
jgi:hypothetical protein